MNRQQPWTSDSNQQSSESPPGAAATEVVQPHVADWLSEGLAHHRTGRLAEAEAHYRQVLSAAPEHADALYLLGIAAYQRGQSETAIDLIGQAIRQNSGVPAYHTGLGLALQALRRLDEALASHDRALALDRDNIEALNNRGLVQQELGRFEEALENYDHALALRPDFAKALNNRGNALRALERYEEAIASYDRALAIEPNLTEAICNRGEALSELEQSRLQTEPRSRSVGGQTGSPPASARQASVEPRALLDSMYRAEPQLGSDGQLHPINPMVKITPEEGALLVQLYAELRPQRTLEVGLGYGFSTLFFMMAMQQFGGGHHIAIDPNQHKSFHGIGKTRVSLLQMEDRFTLIEQPSAKALTLLAAGGLQAQLIFIDGDHRFDSALVDFFLADAICAPNGIIIFDDIWMPSLQRVVRFIANNRSDYRFRPTDIQNAAVFCKIGRDERPWDHYVEF
jgi:tetratricopeptide (TPR) repeat protein